MQQPAKSEVRVSVSVLVYKNNQLLLERRQYTHGANTWGPPTGHMDFGETPEQTATRETREETGVTIDNITFLTLTNDVFQGDNYHIITVWMEATYQAGEAKVLAKDEEDSVGWFTWDNLPTPLYLPFANLLDGNTYPSGMHPRALHHS